MSILGLRRARSSTPGVMVGVGIVLSGVLLISPVAAGVPVGAAGDVRAAGVVAAGLAPLPPNGTVSRGRAAYDIFQYSYDFEDTDPSNGCPTNKYTDVSKTDGYCGAINILGKPSADGWGTKPGTLYYPNQQVNRGEFAAMMYSSKRWSNYTSSPAAPLHPAPVCDPAEPRIFSDVPASSLYCGTIESMAKQGVLRGSGGKFFPTQLVTNSVEASLLLRQRTWVFLPGWEPQVPPRDFPKYTGGKTFWDTVVAHRYYLTHTAYYQVDENLLRPQALLRRGEAADDVFYRMAGYDITRDVYYQKCPPNRFSDVAAASTYCGPINRVGIPSSDGWGTKPGSKFYPNQVINRGELVAMMYSSKRWYGAHPTGSPAIPCDPATPRTFADVPATSLYCAPIEALARAKIIHGTNGKFFPNSAVRYDEATYWIYRLQRWIDGAFKPLPS